MVRLPDVLFRDNKLNAVPPFRLVQPLVRIHGNLRSERFGQNQHVTNDSIVRHDEFVLLTDRRSYSTDSAPRINDTVATGHTRSSFQGGILKSTHYQRNHNVTLLLDHLRTDGKQHQHVVYLRHSHRVQIAQHVGARNLAHHVRIVYDRIEEVRRLHHTQTAVAQWNNRTIEPDANPGRRHRHERLVGVLHIVLLQG
uniref:Uncharacterized protein n=1 Tax=Anopheles christyi TaxID=43041 RepID=A0A182KI61_9DIPT